MSFLVQFRPYQRKFAQPLKTHHGLWQVRAGILVRITDSGQRVGYGEIAPLPWFGSESYAQAWAFCQALAGPLTSAQVQAIPASLPACQFGLESALEDCLNPAKWLPEKLGLANSALLPAGKAALQGWRSLYSQGSRTFKWKIGVAPLEEEIQHFKALLQDLPTCVKLRLDANGGLTLAEAETWLAICDAQAPGVEFLEQPLAIAQFDAMQTLSSRYKTTLALDESVATLVQLQQCQQQGWRGVFVVKPAIAGSPNHLRQFCQQHSLDVVFSSVFETAIGRRAGLRLAAELSRPERAVGYGVSHWFADSWDHDSYDPETLWQNY